MNTRRGRRGRRHPFCGEGRGHDGGLESKGGGLDRGLDGIAVKLDRVTEEEAEEAIDTVEPERPFKVDKSSSSQSSPSSPFAESHPKAAPDARTGYFDR